MEIKYKVHGATQDEFSVVAEVMGNPTTVKVPGVIVELDSLDGSMCHTFRFMTNDVAAVLADYPVGREVTVTITPSEAE